MKWVYIEDIANYEGEEVELRGWLYNRRSSKNIHFLEVRDGTGIMQCVVIKGEVDDKLFKFAKEIPQESSIIVRGRIRADARSKIGYEMDVREIELIHRAEPYPITKKEHGIEFLMDHRHLWLRSRKQFAILKIRALVERAIRDYFDTHGYVLIDAPIFTPSACEGTTTLFETQYFDQKAYLTQSGQLYMEAAAMAFGRVYCFGPTFRAEKSKTRRHLIEFWMVEPEIAYATLDDIMDIAEDFVCYIIERVLDKGRKYLNTLERDISKLENIKKPFPRITYTEAIEILHKNGNDTPWGEDFGGDEETIISNSFDKPVLIHRYPAEVKAFYMKRDPEDERLALCVDMLAPEGYGEIIGGGQREDDYDKLLESIKRHNLPVEAFEWYLDLRRYGSVPHSGFGLGLERTVAWITGVPHVRECIPFPRLLNRLSP